VWVTDGLNIKRLFSIPSGTPGFLPPTSSGRAPAVFSDGAVSAVSTACNATLYRHDEVNMVE
jgi:hypothetical protein